MPSQPQQLEPVAREICQGNGLTFQRFAGSGTFKHVFQVSANDGTHYALKIVNSVQASLRTERECAALQQCSHPAISKLYAVGKHRMGADVFDYSMEEFLSGGTLGDKMAAGQVDVQQVRAIGRVLIDALSHISELKLVHRDIKPENVMFRDGSPSPVLVDFGLVRDLQRPSITASWAPRGPGTPYYAASEQLNNQKRLIDWRTDQFALAVCLSVACFGMHPYQLDGEPLFDHRAVTRVSNREAVPQSFVSKATLAGFAPLIRMAAPWPHLRYRTPENLMAAWSE